MSLYKTTPAERCRNLYQRRREQGLCVRCGKRLDCGSQAQCRSCLEAQRDASRGRNGFAPHSAGGRGRPPLTGTA